MRIWGSKLGRRLTFGVMVLIIGLLAVQAQAEPVDKRTEGTPLIAVEPALNGMELFLRLTAAQEKAQHVEEYIDQLGAEAPQAMLDEATQMADQVATDLKQALASYAIAGPQIGDAFDMNPFGDILTADAGFDALWQSARTNNKPLRAAYTRFTRSSACYRQVRQSIDPSDLFDVSLPRTALADNNALKGERLQAIERYVFRNTDEAADFQRRIQDVYDSQHTIRHLERHLHQTLKDNWSTLVETQTRINILEDDLEALASAPQAYDISSTDAFETMRTEFFINYELIRLYFDRQIAAMHLEAALSPNFGETFENPSAPEILIAPTEASHKSRITYMTPDDLKNLKAQPVFRMTVSANQGLTLVNRVDRMVTLVSLEQARLFSDLADTSLSAQCAD